MPRHFPNRFVVAPLLLLISVFLTQPARADFVQHGSKQIGAGASGQSQQGWSVAISADGSTALVGGPTDAAGAGAFWFYVRGNDGAWTPQGGKTAGNNMIGLAEQGYSVALSADGNTALIGGPFDNSRAGAAWVFVRSNGVWSQQGKLFGNGAVPSANEGAYQGWSVALSADGNTALVGGFGDNNGLGAAWVFKRTGGSWAQDGNKLVGTGGTAFAQQGNSVALSADGKTALIGGPLDSSNTGAAWVFTRTSGTWLQYGDRLFGTGNSGPAKQCTSVALSADGKTAACGGPYDANGFGATWVFTFNGSTWNQQGNKLVGAGATGSLVFQGISVSLSGDGDTLLFGANQDACGAGAAWVFRRSNGSWSQAGYKLVGSGAGGAMYAPQQGYSAALSADGNIAIVGGIYDNTAGAAWFWSRRVPHDFDGDGKSDIVWRNTSGEAGLWLMNSGSIRSAPSLGVVPNSWSIVGQRAVSYYGNSNLMWLNTVGDFCIWFMNGAQVVNTPVLANVGTSWKVVATGDFNGDLQGDIVWRNAAGDLGIWFMYSASYVPVGLGNIPTNWSVMGTGDFNGDGKADILWRNTANDIGVWFMNVATITSTATLGNVGSSWSVAGLGDFNGDGKTDILWRSSSNDVGLWLMNGSSVTPVGLGNVGSAWNVASVGDYNGDGKADILWRSTSHDIGIWFMNGATLLSTSLLGNVGPTWQVQNAASN